MNVHFEIKPGVANKLILYMVLFSSFITILTTGVQLYRDYLNDIGLIEAQLDEAQTVHLKSLAATLWASDVKELKTHLEGMSRRRDMQFLEIKDKDRVWVSIGNRQIKNVISREYSIVYEHLGRQIEIGTLTIIASLSGVYQRLVDKTLIILISNGFKTFLVAGFILFLFHALATRHLIRIADFIRRFDIYSGNKLLLDRQPNVNRNLDELDLVVNAINDMQSNLKESFSALKQSQGLVQLLMDSTAEAIYGIDTDGRCTFVNKACIDMLGFEEASEVLGQDTHQLFHHTRKDGTPYPVENCNIYRAAKQGERIHIDNEVFWRKNNTSFVAEYWSHPIYQVDKLVGAVVTFFDITDRKLSEAELKRYQENLVVLVEARTQSLALARDKALASTQAKSEFMANMSHELRTPLNCIIGFSVIIKEGIAGPVNAEQKKQLGMVYDSAKHLLELINGVLDISKVEAGKNEVNKSRFELSPLLDELKKMMSLQAQEKGLQLKIESGKTSVMLFTDRNKLRQVLVNLLGNAVKFTEQGSVTLACRQDGETIVLEVKDTGIGIKVDHLDGIFDAFRQVEGSDTRVHQGTGLGLTICKEFVLLLGGDIKLESQIGRGSTFSVYLPDTVVKKQAQIQHVNTPMHIGHDD